MKKRLVSLLLCVLMALSCCCGALAVDAVPLSENDPFSVDLPEGWVKMDVDLSSSSIMGYTPAAMYDYTAAGYVYRAFVLHITGFASPITLQQVQGYLGMEGISASGLRLNGIDMLESYVPSLRVYGVAFLDQDATGYYIVGAIPGAEGILDAQPAFIRAFFNGIRFGAAQAEAPAQAEKAESAAASELQVRLDAVQAVIADTEARLDQLAAEMAELQTTLDQYRAEESELIQALARMKCQYCGYEFPEGSEFNFCPLCGAPR